jgi:CRP-like cAMP-binding protein
MIEQLKQLFPLGEQQWVAYEKCFKRLSVPAKTILLEEGKVSQNAYYIEKGCARVWFNNNGKDTTFQFFFENDRVSSIESFKKQIPSLVTIETIEPCILWVIGKKDLDQIMKDGLQRPEIRDKMIDTLFERNIHYMKHSLSFIKDTPIQRYLNLLNENPQVIKRVPQHYIASYLGITTVHLSRIKNQLLKKS